MLTLYYPTAITSTPPGLPSSGTVGTDWEWAGSIQHHQLRILNRFPSARPQYLDEGMHVRWIERGRIVGEVMPDPERRSEWLGWALERSSDAEGRSEAVDETASVQGSEDNP